MVERWANRECDGTVDIPMDRVVTPDGRTLASNTSHMYDPRRGYTVTHGRGHAHTRGFHFTDE